MNRRGFVLALALSACGRLNFAPVAIDSGTADEDAGFEIDASVAPRFLYYVEGISVMRYDIDTTATTTLLTPSAPEELAINGAGGELFITDNVDGAIYVASLDTGEAGIFATGLGRPEGIQYDRSRQRAYFTDKEDGTINRVSAGGAITIILGGLQDPDGLSYHAAMDTLFFSDRLAGTIGRVRPDGSAPSTILSGLDGPEGISVHAEFGVMYWLEANKIRSANLDGSEIIDIVPSGVIAGEGVTVDQVRGQLYWSDEGSRTVGRANLDGSNETIVVNASAKLEGLVTGP